MFLRVSRVKRNDKLYAYTQLVESYRRESDGLPQHRVVANLGKLSTLEIENLRAALKASKTQNRVFVPEEVAPNFQHVVTHNYHYLDIAVLLTVWQHWELDSLLNELLPRGDSEVPPSDVVKALVVQRCVAPGSKLSAERWFPTTSLPELLEIDPQQFNNTRLHRTLEALEAVDGPLQTRLARHQQRRAQTCHLFVDATDTWFEGRGPELAKRRKTKEGLWRYRIGIVLLCDADGLPLRWKMVGGRVADNRSIMDLIEQVKDEPWLDETPLVIDRALGSTADLTQLSHRRIHFVTALRRPEFLSYTDAIPWPDFLELELDVDHPKETMRMVSEVASRAGLTRVSETLYVKDLGLLSRGAVPPVASSDSESDDLLQQAIRTARELQAGIDSGRFASQRHAAAQFGRTQKWAVQRLKLLKLPPFMQDDIERGGARGLSLTALAHLASKPVDEAAAQYQQLKAASTEKVRPQGQRRAQRKNSAAPVEIRGVVYFNPQMFIRQRQTAAAQLQELFAYINELNANARTATRTPTLKSLVARSERHSAHEGLTKAFDIQAADRDGVPHLDVRLINKEWVHRRRFDGFSLIAAHPDLEYTAEDLASLYRAKDAVEKDFQTIKGVIALRPVWHQTEVKVRAHITLCMLALLLHRTLHRQLAQASLSAQAALELLATCHLNLLALPNSTSPLYTITRPTTEQRRILDILDLTALANDEHLNESIHPRPN